MLILARARRVGPRAVLGDVMARAVATIPPNVVIPSIVGGRMSLNMCFAPVGASGAGKGGAAAAGEAGFVFTTAGHIEMLPIGSGEGIARTFRPAGTTANEPNPIAQAIFVVPEVDTWSALASRSGSTLSSEVRKLYSGEPLGLRERR